MYHTIYLITNQVNGKKYIGKHSTDNLDDGYMGSGIAIKKALQKHGTEKFIKEYLHIFDNEYDMEQKEKEIITEDIVKDNNYYNMAPGGQGGNVIKHSEESKKRKSQAISKKLKGKPKSEAHRKSISLFHADMKGENNPMYGKKQSQNAIHKISEKAKDRFKEKMECIHCGKMVDSLNYKRWHGDNCKIKG